LKLKVSLLKRMIIIRTIWTAFSKKANVTKNLKQYLTSSNFLMN
ncbi:hypothetical protein T01_16303, partial [Trichinella spiralis]